MVAKYTLQRSRLHPIEDLKMTQTHRYVLAGFGFFSLLLLFFGAGLLDSGKIEANTYLWVQAVAILIGLFTLAAAIEKMLPRGLQEFKSSALWWTVGLAILAYFARVAALDDVNKVFHIDPSGLPMTLAAANVMRFFIWMEWPFIVVACISFVVLILIAKGTYFPDEMPENERAAGVILVLSIMMNCILCALFIHFHLDEQGRQQKLYRTAHAADFVSKFHCQGIDPDKFSVLFIGPEQRKVLVAPKLPAPVLFGKMSAEFLQALKVPAEFPTLDCVPTVDFEQWSKDLSTVR